jgi:sugar transferase (PEP-CTERM/EpsH1 system associated)
MSGEILFLAHRVPYPPNRGDKMRSWNMLKAMAKVAPVHVAALADDPADLAHADTIKEVAASVHLIPHQTNKLGAMAQALMSGGSASVHACGSAAMREAVAELLGRHPITTVYAFSGQMAQFVPAGPGAPRFVMDFVDMDSAKFAQWAESGSPVARLANRFEARRLFGFERSVAHRADVSLFVSEAEASLFRSATGLPPSRVMAVQNGSDLDHYTPDFSASPLEGEGPHLVFTGQMDYAPNVEAVVHFARDVFPAIKAKHPTAHFWIVGRAPTAAVKALASLPGVSVTGAVDDPRRWIASADLIVAPLLLARGIQNKVLEAMAMGKAVLASGPAAEGIDAAHGTEMAVATGVSALTAEALRLLADPTARLALGQAARARMEARYSWSATTAGLADILGLGSDQRAAA